MKNRLSTTIFAALTSLAVAAPVVLSSGCAAEMDVYHDKNGHAYNHRHYQDEEVYQREDGHWYARRHNAWVGVTVD